MYKFGPFQLDPQARRVLRDGSPIPLTPKSFDLLHFLVKSQGRALSKSELMEALWPDTHVEDGNLSYQVLALRRALGPEGAECIETVPRFGYRLVAPVIAHAPLPAGEPTAAPATALIPVAAEAAVATPAGSTSRSRWKVYLALLLLLSAGALIMLRPAKPFRILAPVPLASFPGTQIAPSLSPDGKDVAFVWQGLSRENWDVYVKVAGVEEPLRFTTSEEVDFSPAWSPDGRKIAFARQSGAGNLDIISKPYPAGPERTVAQVRPCSLLYTASNKVLAWHPDGDHLIVAGAVGGGRACGLSSVLVSNGAIATLTQPSVPSEVDFAPAVSSDGRTLAFVRGADWSLCRIYTMPLSANGRAVGQPRALTTSDWVTLWPAWLPGSHELLFTVVRSTADGSLFTSSVSTAAQPRPVEGVGTVAWFPTVSAGGNIVYSSGKSSSAAIVRIDLDTASLHEPSFREIAPTTHLQQSPQYSPDGGHIAFESERSGHREIWVSDAAGGQLRKLSALEDGIAQAPRWSPDGKRIACSIARGRARQVYTFDVKTGVGRRLTEGDGDNASPSWSGDGTSIYFHSNRSGEFQVWKMGEAGGRPTQVTRGGGFRPQESPDGQFLYFTKRGEHVSLWRIPTSGGPERRMLDAIHETAGFVATKNGIYFARTASGPGNSSEVCLLDPTGGRVTRMGTIPWGLGWGMSIAPDGRDLLAARRQARDFDLMIARITK